MKRKDYIQYKAIETVYSGYRFRSRLEARWGVFFDTLGIKWEYEKEGFDLNGTYYLPDFWLPDEKCWVEIKGQDPTEEEMRKARELAICTQKDVVVISGSIAPADEPYMQDIRLEHSPSIFAHHYKDSGDLQGEHRHIPASPEILSLLQSLSDIHLRVKVEEGYLSIEPSYLSCYGSVHLVEFSQKLQKQASLFPQLIPLIKHYEGEIVETLTVPGDEEAGEWSVSFNQHVSLDDEEWSECTGCHEVSLVASGFPHIGCPEAPQGRWANDTPRIKAAYTAARQARFERFEKSRSEARS